MFVLLAALAVILMTAAPARAADPIDHTQAPAPDGTPVCAKWVHDRYTVERGGRSWPTWHPPRDPRYHCAFGHEHGSNPRAFRFFARTGMPAFGPIGAYAASDEPHAGFKVFVVNDDRKGLAWMVVLHQGSGSPRRGTVRFHSLETWLFARDGRRLAAHTRHMADFGAPVPNCPGAPLAASMRLLPSPSCRSVYEEWDTALDVGGALRGNPGFAIDNAITQFDPASPDRIVFNKGFACGPNDPAGWDSYCKGDKRTVFHPRWVVRNRGRSRFRTDAYGRRAPAGLRQLVSRRLRIDQSGECCGAENAFIMERPSDGGIYRAGRGLNSSNFEFPGYCVIRSN
ncbi:MAG: hypothetical protein QOD71_3326 [Thermoleophilaceae bacterium]|jgi:hypothetical protein|nr:hypothetical protein [Thermoleophilaceae bacterium]